MGKLLIVLFSSPMQFESTDTACNFAEAAVNLGHEVIIFCDIDGVYNVKASRVLCEEETMAFKMTRLIEKGVQVFVCMESARHRGIARKELIRGVKESSLAKLVVLMDETDRVATFKF